MSEKKAADGGAKGYLHFRGIFNGTVISVSFEFDGRQQFRDVIEIAKVMDLTADIPVFLPPNTQVVPGGEVRCPDHPGKTLKKNAGKGPHKWYCSGQKEDGSWCGRKFFDDGTEYIRSRKNG